MTYEICAVHDGNEEYFNGFLPGQAEISRIGWIQPVDATWCHKKNISSNSAEPAGFNRVEVELTLYRRTRWNESPVLEKRLATRVTFSAAVATSQIILFRRTETKKQSTITKQQTTNTKHKTTLPSIMPDDGYDTNLIDLALAARNCCESLAVVPPDEA